MVGKVTISVMVMLVVGLQMFQKEVRVLSNRSTVLFRSFGPRLAGG
jgi:hypothetical protein